jgi:Flp pilus assembly protein TadD
MMQTYGFCRIYDSKVGSFAALTRRLDFGLCAVWFAAAILLSSRRMADTMEGYYATGGPFIQPWLLLRVQQGILVAAALITVAFVVHFAHMWLIGKRPNPVKVVLLGTSIGFWWFCNNGVANILAGIALFEVFHDVQYLSLVWLYNRNRVEKDSSIGGFMRFVFRRSGALVGLYIGLVFAYGSLAYFKDRVDIDTIKKALTGVVLASGLLHFYYDGFIWKVRERSTRESLGLAGGTTGAGAGSLLPSWLVHGLKWVAIFIVPLTLLLFGQKRGPAPIVQREGWLVENFPSLADQRFHYAESLASTGAANDAAEQYRIGLGIDPNDEKAHYGYAHVLLSLSQDTEARQELRQAIKLSPSNGEFRSDYALILEKGGRNEEARIEHQEALRLAPGSARVHYNYGLFLGRQGRIPDAAAEFEAAVKLKPDYVEAHSDLGKALYVTGDFEKAKQHYVAAAQLDPQRATSRNNLAVVYLRLGQVPAAIAEFKEALRLEPNYPAAAENLRRTLEEQARTADTKP